MRHVNGPIFIVAALLLGGCLLFVTGGCDGSGSLVDDPVYRLSGNLIGNVNLDTTSVVVTILRDSSDYSGATVRFGGGTMLYSPSGISGVPGRYTIERNSVQAYAGDTVTFSASANNLDQTFSVRVPDTFSVSIVSPANRISNGALLVTYPV